MASSTRTNPDDWQTLSLRDSTSIDNVRFHPGSGRLRVAFVRRWRKANYVEYARVPAQTFHRFPHGPGAGAYFVRNIRNHSPRYSWHYIDGHKFWRND